MSVALTLVSTIQALETLSAALNPAAANPQITHSGYNTSKNLNAGSTPPVSQVAAGNQALTTGAATIDLTAVPGTNGVNVNGNGLKVAAAKFINPITNANPITVKAGATNAYLLGGAAWSFILQPGQSILLDLGAAAPAIGATTKNIDLAGTGSQALEYIFLIG